MWSGTNMITVLILLVTAVETGRIEMYKRNISRCADQGELYYAEDDQCYPPISQGPCRQSEMLVLSDSGVGVCAPDTCPGDTTVMYDGKCLGMCQLETCWDLGQSLRWNIRGQGYCGCEDGWGFIEGMKGCYPLSWRGPCAEGEVVMEKDKFCSRIGMFETIEFYRDRGEEAYSNKLKILKELNCGMVGWEECCDLLQGGGEIELYDTDVEQAFSFRPPTYECGPSRSTRELSPNVSTCSDLDIRSVVRSRPSRCRSGRFWSRFQGRCVSRFK